MSEYFKPQTLRLIIKKVHSTKQGEILGTTYETVDIDHPGLCKYLCGEGNRSVIGAEVLLSIPPPPDAPQNVMRREDQ